MSRYLYSFSIVRTDGAQSLVYDADPDKGRTLRLLDAIQANVPGRTFKLREHRKANPAFVTA